VKRAALAGVLAAVACSGAPDEPTLKIGSKGFTESVVLGELATLVSRASGVPAQHRREIGGTRVLWDGLLRGDIDAYPEYTGTMRKEIFAGRALDGAGQLEAALAEQGVRLGPPLGFDNGYVLGMREEVAARLGIRTIWTCAHIPSWRSGSRTSSWIAATAGRRCATRTACPNATSVASTTTSVIAAFAKGRFSSSTSTPPTPRSGTTTCAR